MTRVGSQRHRGWGEDRREVLTAVTTKPTNEIRSSLSGVAEVSSPLGCTIRQHSATSWNS